MKKYFEFLINLFNYFINANKFYLKNTLKNEKKAVLLIFFNRIDDTKSVFEQIRIAQPPRLYLACDGARKFVDGENDLVNNLRNWILEHIDWPCEVHTLFREKNIGCGPSCSGAITWFFENEECGIIFEDDCVPCQSFFKFCDELLDKYRNNKKIWGISGNNYCEDFQANETYLFTRLTSGWGWATWRSRWNKFNFNLTGWNDKFIKKFHSAAKVRNFYKFMFDRKKKADGGWAFQWQLLVMKHNGLFIHPTKNLVKNIGISGATYQDAFNDPMLHIPTHDFEKIVHPKRIKENKKYLDFQLKLYCNYNAEEAQTPKNTEKRFKNFTKTRHSISFKADEDDFYKKGFFTAESGGTWINEKASICLQFLSNKDIDINLSMLTYKGQTEKFLKIYANDILVCNLSGLLNQIKFTIPKEVIKGKWCTLSFENIGSEQPKNDFRSLAYGIITLQANCKFIPLQKDVLIFDGNKQQKQ